MNSMNPGKKSVKPKSPAKAAPQKFINKKPVKVTPTKKLQHMPGKWRGVQKLMGSISNYPLQGNVLSRAQQVYITCIFGLKV